MAKQRAAQQRGGKPHKGQVAQAGTPATSAQPVPPDVSTPPVPSQAKPRLAPKMAGYAKTQLGLLPSGIVAGLVVAVIVALAGGLLYLDRSPSGTPNPIQSPTPPPALTVRASPLLSGSPAEPPSPTLAPSPTATLLPTAPPYARASQPTWAMGGDLRAPAPPLKGTVQFEYPNEPPEPCFQDLKCRWVVIHWQEPNPDGVTIRIYAVTECRQWSSGSTPHCVISGPPIQDDRTWVADVDATLGFHRFLMVKAAGTASYLDTFPERNGASVYGYEVQAINQFGGSANVPAEPR